MNTNLLLQLIQSMGGEQPMDTPEMQTCQVALPPPFDMMCAMRHMFPPKEQKMIDLMIKMFEIKMLMEEIQCS